MNRATALLAGAGLGAGLMYFLDPDRGRSRRAWMRDKAVHAAHEAQDAACVVGRDLRQRSQGLMAEAQSRLREDHVSDDVLVERVRSQMGRVVSHPRAIEVMAHNGRVTLRGPILANE